MLAAAVSGGDASDMQTGAWVAANSTQYNYLTDHEMQTMAKELSQCSGTGCDDIARRYLAIHEINLEGLQKACDGSNIGACQAKAAQIEDAIFKWQKLGYGSDLERNVRDVLGIYREETASDNSRNSECDTGEVQSRDWENWKNL